MGGFGQDVLVTPLQLARMMRTILTLGDAAPLGPPDAAAPAVWTTGIRADALRRLMPALHAVAERGTASSTFGEGTDVIGKTATAREGGVSTGMFVCAAPASAPRYVVVVALDEPEVNGAAAAKVAGAILRRLGAV
jgi:cell division protein FtsI/penicillin-binding protein 2